MKKLIPLVFLFLLKTMVIGQDSTATDTIRAEHRTANGFALMPFKADQVNGLGFSWGFGNIDWDYGNMEKDIPYLKVNGLHTYTSPLQLLGAAFVAFHLPFIMLSSDFWTDTISSKEPYYGYQNGEINGASIAFWETGESMAMNGVQISLLYHKFEFLRGFSFTSLSAQYDELKGVMISGISNDITTGSGVQLALINKADDLKGVQIGLWNKIGKRGLPFINIGF